MTDKTLQKVKKHLNIIANSNFHNLGNDLICIYNQLQANAALAKQTLAELNSYIEAIGISQQWQPIETAPKDRVKILLIRDNGYLIESKTPVAEEFYDKGKWWCSYNLGEYRFQPTHWMPLPQPPKAMEGE